MAIIAAVFLLMVMSSVSVKADIVLIDDVSGTNAYGGSGDWNAVSLVKVGDKVDSSTSNSLRSRLGVICSTITQIKGRTVAPELFAGWSHEFIDDEDISGRFVNGSAKFSSDVDSGRDDRFYYGAGMTALLKTNISAYIRYEGEQLSGGNSHTFNAGVKILF